MGQSMQKIRRAIQGIDYETLCWIIPDLATGFFRQDSRFRAGAGQFLNDRPLCFLIGGGDEIARSLAGYLQLLHLSEIAHQHATGLFGGLGHYV